MGTLTAEVPRLIGHCLHKLPTSCRLTADPRCCACQDRRAHTPTYRTYIDGVGFVYRGTRWQGYCWYCQVFWKNRMSCTQPRIEPNQSRIPEYPEQSRFCERWFEFHQGYRVVKRDDGVEERIAVLGEPFMEVTPGTLPRTLQELRAGRHRSAADIDPALAIQQENTDTNEPQQSLDDALDELLNEASDDETPLINRPHQQTSRRRSSSSHQNLVVRARREAERFARVFGTREDIQRDDYQSPVSGLFNRAYERYRQREDLRSEVAMLTRNSGIQVPEEDMRVLLQQLLPPPWNVTEIASGSNATVSASTTQRPPNRGPEITLSSTEINALLDAQLALSSRGNNAQSEEEEEEMTHLDNDSKRPVAKTNVEMTIRLSCHICYSQKADTACLPCGHMVMCQWCADIVIPTKQNMRHIPARPSKCPTCRKKVTQRVKIFTM